MNRRWKWIGGILILLAIGGVLYGWQPWATREVALPSGGLGSTIRVGRGDVVRILTAFGEVVPKDELTLSFAGDKLSEIRVKEGDKVKQGQILAILENLQEKLTMLKAQDDLAKARVEGIPRMITEKELEYEIAKQAYDATTVRAPFPGVVTYAGRAKDTPDSYKISLLDRSEFLIEASIPELDIDQVSLGQEGTAMINALPGRTWPVKIVQIGYQATQESGFGGGKVVTVTAKFLKVDPTILPGFSAQVQITTAAARGVLRVPIEALIKSDAGWTVMVVENGMPKLRPVEVGVTSDQFAEITSGLKEGEEILRYPAQAPGGPRASSTSGTMTNSKSQLGVRIFRSP